jgi:L-malate glycosyltransferase
MVKNRVRLLMIVDKFEVGGTETYVLAVVEQLLKKRVYVCVAGKYGILKKKFVSLGCPVYTEMKNQRKLEQWIR